ncbi:protein PF14_0175-like isoform X2 [Aricia agestis]|uniref:protein PF14_0175-like isoform X2 n=1 Tax=Aricia agestis TaxID=91739 RepID=UPI001C20BA6C|nr:protein PF14_0175-like isoform X2 [Aricia agestis]
MSSRCILGCSPQERSKTIHHFPSPNIYPQLYEDWLKVIPSKYDKKKFDHRRYRICDRHFEEKAKYGVHRLQRWAVPKLHLPTPVDAHDSCDSPKELNGNGIVWEIKELIKYEHSYATPRNSNGELQKEDTIMIVDDTPVNTNGNIGNTTKVDLTKLIDSYNIEQTCYSDAEQLISHLNVSEVIEIASIADNKENIASQDQSEIRETLQNSEDIISNCDLLSCDDLLSNKEECQNINTKNSVSIATTKYTENTRHVLNDGNVNKVNESNAGYKRKRKYIFYPIQPKSGQSAIISKREISEITTKRNNCAHKAYICFDENSVFKKTQPKVNKIKPLLINSISFFNTQNNTPNKQSVPSAFVDFAPFKCRDKVLNASLLLNLENKDRNSLKFEEYNANDLNQLEGKNSLQQSGRNINVNSIREESIREICEQANSEYRSIPNNELCLSDNYTQNNAIIQDYLSTNPDRHIISESKSIPNNELCLSDIHTLNNGIQRLLCTSPDRHVSVRICEENCVNPAGPVSLKPAKLHVSELDVDVGSTTIVYGGFEPNDDEPVEDPLAIHSPDLGIKDSGAFNDDSMMCSVENNINVVEDHNVSNVEDNMSIIKDNISNAEDNISNVEGNISDLEDNMSITEINMSNLEDNISNVEGNLSDVEDNMSIIEINMSNIENNISNVEGNLSDVEDNMSIIEISKSNIEDHISNVEGNLSDVKDNISMIKDNMSNIEDNISIVEGNISDVEDNMSITEINMSNIEDNISNVEGNLSDVEDNMSIIEINMSNIENNISNVEGNLSDVEDNMSIIEINRSNIEDNISNVEGNLSDVEDSTSIVENMSTKKDNMSYKKDTKHLVDRLDSKHCIDDLVHREECNDDLDLRLEIAFALKFMYKKDKTLKEAVEEIIETYGKGKLTLKEAKCWYHEFKLGNNIMRIISSGGPVYK